MRCGRRFTRALALRARAGRSALAAVLCVACGGCAARAVAQREVARSPAAPAASTPDVRDEAPTREVAVMVTPVIDRSYRAKLARVGEPFRSNGHAGGRWNATAWANEAGASALAGADPAKGALVVVDLDASGDPGPTLVMQKRGASGGVDDWYFAVLGAGGTLAAEGALAGCASCHGASSRGGLFPLGQR